MEITVLDVGHGNAAFCRDGAGWVLIDAAPGGTVQEFIRRQGIDMIDLVLISHADDDHLGGLTGLLSAATVRISSIYLNPDSRTTTAWKAFRVALADARLRAPVEVHTELTSELTFDRHGIRYSVEAPDPVVALAGVGGTTAEGVRLSPNTLSGVVRVIPESGPVVCLFGDIDADGFELAVKYGARLDADVVVFPHHGGRSGRNDADFAERVARVTGGQEFVFSNSRRRAGFPRKDAIAGLRRANPSTYVACTQLTEACAATLPSASATGGTGVPARGVSDGSCCAGSIQLVDEGGRLAWAERQRHARFVSRNAPSAMCVT